MARCTKRRKRFYHCVIKGLKLSLTDELRFQIANFIQKQVSIEGDFQKKTNYLSLQSMIFMMKTKTFEQKLEIFIESTQNEDWGMKSQYHTKLHIHKHQIYICSASLELYFVSKWYRHKL